MARNQVHYVRRSRQDFPEAGISVGDSYYWYYLGEEKRKVVSRHRPSPRQMRQERETYLNSPERRNDG